TNPESEQNMAMIRALLLALVVYEVYQWYEFGQRAGLKTPSNFLVSVSIVLLLPALAIGAVLAVVAAIAYHREIWQWLKRYEDWIVGVVLFFFACGFVVDVWNRTSRRTKFWIGVSLVSVIIAAW